MRQHYLGRRGQDAAADVHLQDTWADPTSAGRQPPAEPGLAAGDEPEPLDDAVCVQEDADPVAAVLGQCLRLAATQGARAAAGDLRAQLGGNLADLRPGDRRSVVPGHLL